MHNWRLGNSLRCLTFSSDDDDDADDDDDDDADDDDYDGDDDDDDVAAQKDCREAWRPLDDLTHLSRSLVPPWTSLHFAHCLLNIAFWTLRFEHCT